MVSERQKQIMQILEQKGEIQLKQLKEIFPDVSAMTLRRDLNSLEEEGRLIRTYGGAVSVKKVTRIAGEEDAYSIRAAENVEAKMKIAKKAVTLMERGRSIFFDAGSTVMCLARLLPDESYSIITDGVNTALELIKKPRLSVVLLGGLVNRNTLSVSGPEAMSSLDSINIDLAFMAASGFSIESGFTVSNIYECELKKKLVKRAKKVILLMDVSKINKNMAFTYAGLEDIDVWVADEPLPPEVEAEAARCGVCVM